MSSDHEEDHQENHEQDEEVVQENVDIYFEPLVTLKAVEVRSDEDDNDLLFKTRSKLYRFHKTEENEGEWKERGTGDVKLLQSKTTHKVQLLMRREKTHKIAALHLITEQMQLKPCLGSDRAWLWSVYADYADEAPTSEVFAIKFPTTEAAMQFKQMFEEAQVINKSVNEGTFVPGAIGTAKRSEEEEPFGEEAKPTKAEEAPSKESTKVESDKVGKEEAGKEESKHESDKSSKEEAGSKDESEHLTSKLEATAISKPAEEPQPAYD